jgi:hypothetical protein
MNKQKAEEAIVSLVQQVDAIRASDMTEDKKVRAIALIDEEIKDLKKITGPRRITGTLRL